MSSESARPSPVHRLTSALARVRALPWADVCSFVILGLALANAIHLLAQGWERPLLDRHGARQTQTAISAWSIARGGPWLSYETPVFGAPYSLPFEFPLFQWIVVGVHGLARVPLDQSGRLVSTTFFLATLIPIYRLFRSFDAPRWSGFLCVALFLVSPIYLYWARAFLIESTALFFSLAALAYGHDVVAKRRGASAHVLLCAAATLGALVKVTTAFGYLVSLALLLLVAFANDPERRSSFKRHVAAGFAMLFVPLVAVILWTRFADALKRENVLTAHYITSDALREWNYGTWELKTAPYTWQVLWDRTTLEAFGGPVFFCIAASFAFVRAKRWAVVGALTAGILATYATFTSLHCRHDYYQYATCAFVILIAGFGIAATEARGWRWLLVLGLVLGGGYVSLKSYKEGYYVDQTERYWLEVLDVTAAVRRRTEPNELIYIVGHEWNPAVPYYARRRALMNTWDYAPTDPRIVRTLERSRRAGNPLGAVVFCGNDRMPQMAAAAQMLGHEARCDFVRVCNVCY